MTDTAKWVGFIQAHLDIERKITSLIESNLAAPDLLKIDELRFAQKARLMAAMGLSERWILIPILAANGVRNRLVHRPNHDITIADELTILRSFPAAYRRKTDELRVYEKQLRSKEPTAAPDIRYLMSWIAGNVAMAKEVFRVVREHDKSVEGYMKKALSAPVSKPKRKTAS